MRGRSAWKASVGLPSLSDDRRPQWRLWLPRGEVSSVRDEGQHSLGRDRAAPQHADLEAGSLAQVPIMPQGEVCSAGPHDQANGRAGNYALRLGVSGRGALSRARVCARPPKRPALVCEQRSIPNGRECLCLSNHQIDSGFLKIRRVSISGQQLANLDPHSGPNTLFSGPVDRSGFPDGLDEGLRQ